MSIDLKITNLKAFNKKLNKKLQDNKVKEYVTRGTMMVQNTAKESNTITRKLILSSIPFLFILKKN